MIGLKWIKPAGNGGRQADRRRKLLPKWNGRRSLTDLAAISRCDGTLQPAG
jgi:hypothetical protein